MNTCIIRKSLFVIPCFVFADLFSQQKITGKIVDENNISLNSVLIVNISSNKSSHSDPSGQFVIEAQENDEVRFVKDGYYRTDKKITNGNVNIPFNVTLLKAETVIPEVKITYKPTGNLEKDSKYLDGSRKIASLNSSMEKYMKSPLNEALPNNSISKTFQGHDFSVGQVDMVKLIGSAIGLVKKATQPKITKPDYFESRDFINKLKTEMDLEFLKKYGMTEEQIDKFLLYANDTRGLAKKYRKNFNTDTVETELRVAFALYKKTEKIGD
ncbi:hypothetical protein [Chryseobacterium limigenitum]|uniref:CarboxypepD_reg-like domain-containing protein n=1 Tax=Chryseobacterium limigenitum TaxID=1612149 RepID=A0A1K2IGE0_9FLAO|nr:hypothetical protein [Chryseobacterium limigenitum]SFZ91366.1 hypothetical protein SAMN05216324_102325 [Chryseobacterium limigenitum]